MSIIFTSATFNDSINLWTIIAYAGKSIILIIIYPKINKSDNNILYNINFDYEDIVFADLQLKRINVGILKTITTANIVNPPILTVFA